MSGYCPEHGWQEGSLICPVFDGLRASDSGSAVCGRRLESFNSADPPLPSPEQRGEMCERTHPGHYDAEGEDLWQRVRPMVGDLALMYHHIINATEYAMRAEHKGGAADLDKAITNLQRAKQLMEGSEYGNG